FGRPVNWILTWFFRAFERAFDYSVGAYTRTVSKVLRVSAVALVLYGGLLALTWWSFTNTPTGFIPAQDKGYLLVNVQLPDAAAMPRTARAVAQVEAIALSTPGVKHTVAMSGESILLNTNAPNFGALYVMLDDFDKRSGPDGATLSADAIAAKLQERFDK